MKINESGLIHTVFCQADDFWKQFKSPVGEILDRGRHSQKTQSLQIIDE